MKTRIKHLDGMRGLAILLVIAYHAYARWPQLLNYVSITKNFSLFEYGYLGVPLFFMISGFVIFMTLDKSNNFPEFMKKRWLRLFPAMLIATLIIYLTASFFTERPGGYPALSSLFPGLILISPEILSWFSNIHFASLEGSFWSLYVEIIFYIFIGVVYFTAGRKYCLPSLIIPMILVAAASVIKMKGYSLPADIISKFGFIHYSWFMIGCLVYERMHNRDALFHYGLVAAAVVINFSFYIKNSGYFVIIPLVMAIALFVASFYSTFLEKILSTKFLTAIGFSSYALYLIHESSMIASLIKINAFIKNDYIMLFMPILVVTAIYYVAFVITKYAEPAVRNVLKTATLREKVTNV